MKAMSEKKWLSSGYLQAKPQGAVDPSKGVISGVSVTTQGEALGHGVHLDESFIDAVVEQGNSKKSGLKARFGHPNMCSTALGTFIGRFKNFSKQTVTRNDGSEAFRAVADLFMSNSAKETPNGNLYDYVFSMAKSESDMFGTSIVFTPGRYYKKQPDGSKAYQHSDGLRYTDESGRELTPEERATLSEELYTECDDLHACDTVDDPAANDGLFSRFANETIAGQVTEFLDLNPQVWTAISGNPGILESLAKYADKVDGFIERYRAYRQGQNTGEQSMSNEAETEVAPPEAESPVTAPEATNEIEQTAEPVEVSEPAETEPEATPEQKPAAEQPDPALSQPDHRAEFKRMKSDFGAEIASEVFELGGSYQDALKLAYKRVQKENEELRKRVPSTSGGSPADFVASEGKTKINAGGVHELFEKGTRAKR
jgi:hypothetical protein